MIYNAQRSRVVDYLGNKQHLAADLRIAVGANGGIHIQSGEQRFYEGLLAVSISPVVHRNSRCKRMV
ncbi:DUF4166 domain-containing protein [Paenibacillus sp. NPDC058910]|uniref:DUF4166 domain-containing protein n=1 Tax=unclassified Paenibacillus TaxID=185978 RepID=UPI0036A240A4